MQKKHSELVSHLRNAMPRFRNKFGMTPYRTPTKPIQELSNIRKQNPERKIPISRAQPHQGALPAPRKAACACSDKANLRTRKRLQAKSQNEQISFHSRPPPRRTPRSTESCVRLCRKSQSKNPQISASKNQNEKSPFHARTPTKAHSPLHGKLHALAPKKPI